MAHYHDQPSYNTAHTQWNPVTHCCSPMTFCVARLSAVAFWFLCSCSFTKYLWNIYRLNNCRTRVYTQDLKMVILLANCLKERKISFHFRNYFAPMLFSANDMLKTRCAGNRKIRNELYKRSSNDITTLLSHYVLIIDHINKRVSR